MEAQKLEAQRRTDRGKGPARQIRSEGLIPAVFYGGGSEATALTISPKALLQALDTAWGRNALIELRYDGQDGLAMVKDIQVHPVTRRPLHVDFLRVSRDAEVVVRVPVRASGRAIGVQKGGKLQVVFRDLEVRAKPDSVPAEIVIDVTPLDIGQTISVRDLELDAGVRVTLPPARTVVLVEEESRGGVTEQDAEADAAASSDKPAS